MVVDGGVRINYNNKVMLVTGGDKVITLFLFGHPVECSIFTKGNTY